jgi:hypothetical protein
MEKWSDVRFLSEDGFIFSVSKHVAAAITFTMHYDSNAVAGVKSTDTELKNTLSLTF